MNRRASVLFIIAIAILCAIVPIVFAQQVKSTQVAGGSGGLAFADPEQVQGTRIFEVRVRAGDAVDAVQMVYALPDGRAVVGARHGGGGGDESVFSLDSDEYIIGISGRFGDTVDSLRIHTNKRTSATFGGRGGDNDYRIDVPAGSQATGFVGRSGDLLDSVGLAYTVRYRPDNRYGRQGQTHQDRFPPGNRGAVTGTQVQGAQTTLAGGGGGSPFADGGLAQGARITGVRVRAGDTIDAVQVIYALPDGRASAGPRHGGGGGNEHIFNLANDEYITGISGRCGDTVDSLRIHTNKRTSEIFGGGGGDNDFRIDVPAGNQAIGFVGRSGDTVDAIGLSFAPGQNVYRRFRRP